MNQAIRLPVPQLLDMREMFSVSEGEFNGLAVHRSYSLSHQKPAALQRLSRSAFAR
jgi:hypothetical protein